MTHDEVELVECLDECIRTKKIKTALKILRNVQDTFSRYKEYMEKVGKLIK